GLVPRQSLVLPLVEPELVRGPPHALEVPDAAVGDEALEPRCNLVDREPVHHVAAERGPRGRDSILVHVWQLLDVIEARDEVAVTLAAPVAADLVDEFLTESGRAARVRQDDDIPLCRPESRIPAIAPAVFPSALRAAVDEKRDRPLLCGVEAGGLEDPHLHRHAALDRHLHGFWSSQVELCKQFLIRIEPLYEVF